MNRRASENITGQHGQNCFLHPPFILRCHKKIAHAGRGEPINEPRKFFRPGTHDFVKFLQRRRRLLRFFQTDVNGIGANKAAIHREKYAGRKYRINKRECIPQHQIIFAAGSM